ncbi:MAG: hypothetical protein U0V70_20625 [Terriglobia bacterium]
MQRGQAAFSRVSSPLAYVRCSIPEIVDTGNRGSEESYRTNLGLNNPEPETANVSLELIDSAGSLMDR